MKSNIYILLLFALMLSCKKDISTDELDISYKSTSAVVNGNTKANVMVYPNPFHEIVILIIEGGSATVTISDNKGKFKKIETTEGSLRLSFENEPSGNYYCEVVINNFIFRENLIKLD